MSTRAGEPHPIIEGIDITGFDVNESPFDHAQLVRKLGITWSFSIALLAILFFVVDPGGDVLTRFNGSLFIVLFVAIPSSYYSIKGSRNLNSFERFEQNNGFNVTASHLPVTSINFSSVMSQVIMATDKWRYEQGSILPTANGIRRNNATVPMFFAGRVASENSAYKQYLMLVIDLPKACPHVFVDYDSSSLPRPTNFNDQLSAHQRFELEGSFADTFTLYAPNPDSARFGTYVLTPDVMEKILALSPTADIEIVDQQLIMIWKQRVASDSWAHVLPELFTTLNSIGAELYERAVRFAEHSPAKTYEKLRFNFATKALNTTLVKLENLPGNAGEAFDLVRRRGFWIMVALVIAILFVVITLEVLIGTIL